MIDKIMKLRVFVNLIAGFCLMGAISCSELVSEEDKYAGDNIQLGITDDVEIYPLGETMTIPSYYEGNLELTFSPEIVGDNWLEVPRYVTAGEGIVIRADENTSRRMRVGEITLSGKGLKELTVYQDIIRFEAGATSDLRLSAIKDTVFIPCNSNVNYKADIDLEGFIYMPSDSLRNYSTQGDGGFYLAFPMGALNEERLVRLPINAMDVYGNNVAKKSIAFIDIYQDPYYMQFLSEGNSVNQLTMNGSGGILPFFFNYSGSWTIRYGDPSNTWVKILLDDKELADGTLYEPTSEHDKVQEMKLDFESYQDKSVERSTKFYFSTDYDSDGIDDLEVVLMVKQEGGLK